MERVQTVRADGACIQIDTILHHFLGMKNEAIHTVAGIAAFFTYTPFIFLFYLFLFFLTSFTKRVKIV